MSGPPLHLVPDAPGHGVARYAGQVAGAVGADVADLAEVLRLSPRPVHVHVSDSLFGPTCEEAAEALLAVTRRHPTTVTLHDLPQPEDGPVFARRVAAYAAVLGSAAGWVTSSHHESALARRHLGGAGAGAVVPLPVVPLQVVPQPVPLRPLPPSGGEATVVGLLGWIYPGKGHAEVITACADVAAGVRGPVVVRVLGGAARGHDALVRELTGLADRVGVGLEVSGWVPDDALAGALDAVDVPVAAHRKVSASGSVNSWLAARRRPLVSEGPYAREMAELRPGTLTLVEPSGWARAIARAADAPAGTRLDDGTSTAPGLDEVAAAYTAWWAGR